MLTAMQMRLMAPPAADKGELSKAATTGLGDGWMDRKLWLLRPAVRLAHDELMITYTCPATGRSGGHR